MFIQTDRVAVSDEHGNTITIRRKMDFGAVSRVQGAAPEERLLALYAANILDWSGPAFAGVPCTAENIARLDPHEPLIEAVGNRIAELNPQKQPSPNSMTAGAQPLPDAASAPAEITT